LSLLSCRQKGAKINKRLLWLGENHEKETAGIVNDFSNDDLHFCILLGILCEVVCE
jgi:hypothetical protein